MMKRTLLFSALFAALLIIAPNALAADCTWSRVPYASRSVVGSGAVNCTFTVATQTSSGGINLSSVGTVSVSVCAAAGETISTAFVLSAYVMDPWSLVWSRAPEYDLSNGTTGDLCQHLGGWNVIGPIGRLAYAPSAGAVSAGAMTIRIIASGINGERL
jgi:hypothetical protein